jgi:hypothetical protein
MKKLLLVALAMLFPSSAFADSQPTTINFEQFPEFTQITNQYSAEGAVFTNALELVAPDYDFFDYPPHSGSGVITNDPNDPIEVNFSPGAGDITGWYSAPDGMIVAAFDSSDDLLAFFVGADTNMSNAEFSIYTGTAVVSWIAISAADGADSETVDDLTYTITPEPDSLVLLATGVLGLAGILRRRFVR